MTPCSYPNCPRPAYAAGYCASHYRQHRRGGPLRPLRGPRGQLGTEPLVQLSLRVPEPVRDAAQADPDGARRALGRWAVSGGRKTARKERAK